MCRQELRRLTPVCHIANSLADQVVHQATEPMPAIAREADDGAIHDSSKTCWGCAAGEQGGVAGAGVTKAGGKVALWSMRNQFHPVWSFDTKSGMQQTSITD